MKNKAVVELSIGTIVLIVLGTAMLILALVLVKNITEDRKEQIAIETCKLHEVVEFNCTGGQFGQVVPEIYSVIENMSDVCIAIHKFDCIIR